ncbi:MAG: hypothetical protein Kow0059_06290 [Candidatus Sumerlaeia bacterium]
MLAGGIPAAPAQSGLTLQITHRWTPDIGHAAPNAPLACDLNEDGVADLIVTDDKGQVIVFDLKNDRLYRKVQFSTPLTAPIIGDFLGNSTFDVAVLDPNGRLVLIDGMKLEVIGTYPLGASTTSLLPPTTFPIRDGRTVVCDGVIIVDDEGVVSAWSFQGGEPNKLWEKSLEPIAHPATVAYVTSFTSPDAVVGTRTGRIAVINTQDPEHMLAMDYPDQDGIATGIAARNVDRLDNFDKLFAVTGRGRLIGLRYNKSADRLDEIFEPTPVFESGERLKTPVIVSFRESKISTEDIVRILLADDRRIVSFTPDGRSDYGKEFQPDSAIVTELACLESSVAGPTLTFADEMGQIYFLNARYLTVHERQTVRSITGPDADKVAEQFVHTPLIFDARGASRAYFLYLTGRTGRAVYFETDAPLAPDQIVWQTLGGNTQHTGTWTPAYFDDLNERRKSLQARKQALMEQTRLAFKEERWGDVLRAADEFLEHDPFNSEVRDLRRRAWVKKNLLWLFTLSGVGAAGVLVLIVAAVRTIRFTTLRKKAAQAMEAAHWDAAVAAYRRLQSIRPRDSVVRAGLAHALIQKQDFSEANIALFEEQLERDPDNADLVNALAHCYRNAGVIEDKALPVYERALNIWPPHQRAVLHQTIGRLHMKRRNWEAAAQHFKETLRGGLNDALTYELLADCYVKMKYHPAKALPVFLKAYERKASDPEFLEAACLAMMDAKKMDEQAESTSKALLAMRPDHIPASLFLAQISFQRGAVSDAAAIVQRVLERRPDDEQAIYLLSQCCLVEGRTDPAALDAYRKALEHYPDDKEILTILAHYHFRHDDFTPEAAAIYRRAYAVNPDDAMILRAIGRVALDESDHTLAIEALERLAALGQGTAELYTQLARCYAAIGDTDPRTEKAYRTALAEEPDNGVFLQNLTDAMVKLNRTDAEAIKIFEQRLKRLGASESVGAQLAKAYMENNRFDAAIRLTQALLQKFPGNAEIRRIQALASLHGDQLDQAIAQYTALLQQDPGDREALVNLAMAYSFKGRLDEEAAHLYLSALKIEPDNENLRLTLARVFAARGQMQQCIQEFKTVLSRSPQSMDRVREEVVRTLGEYPESVPLRWFFVELLIKMNHLRDAIEQLGTLFETNPAQAPQIIRTLEFILRKDPQNIAAFVQMGLFLRLSGDFERARAVLEKALEVRPDAAEVHKQLAEVYEKMLTSAENMEIRYHLGKTYYQMGLFDKAIGCFQKTEQDFRWENDSVKMLGKCFLAKGLLDLAFQSYQKIPVDDELKDLLYELAQRYEHQGDIVGAKQVYKIIFAADINYRDVREKFEKLSGATSEPVNVERTSLMNELSESARRRYELLDELGRGAMGIVYRAKDIELDEVVALKILPDNLSNNPEAVRRFKTEARSARRLAHPNIVRIHDIGEEMGRKYISMEYIEGTDLKKILRRHKKLDERTVVEFARQIADALGYAHQLGIVHRDIKPANVMITKNNQVKIADYGIAKLVESTDATVAGAVIGTPLYMSPEQVKGEGVDPRADIYSLGVLLYEMLTGKPPFYEGDLAYQHIHKPPPPLEGFDPDLIAIIMRCLEKDRERRFRNGRELCQALTQLAKKYAQTTTS